jgi:hypothetical protein
VTNPEIESHREEQRAPKIPERMSGTPLFFPSLIGLLRRLAAVGPIIV